MTRTGVKDAVVCKHHANQWSINIWLASGMCDSLAGSKVGETGTADPIASPHAAQKDLKVGNGMGFHGYPGMDGLTFVPAHLHALFEGKMCCPILQATGKAPVVAPALMQKEPKWAALLNHVVLG